VNHHLRAAESDADEIFVCELAAQLRLPIEVHHAPIGPGNMEQLTRDARRAFFAEARTRLQLRAIALGHNQSDQAETVLYRFLRGSGLAGLAGMSPVTADGFIRPMIHLTREEIRTYATAQSILWRDDSSNQNTELVRNRLRLEVFNPQLVRILSANATVARDEEDWWERRLDEIYPQMACETRIGLQFSVDTLNQQHPAEQRRILRRAIRNVKGDLRSIDLSHTEALRKLIESKAGHDRILLPGVDALRSFGRLLLAQPGVIGKEARHYQMAVEFNRDLALPYGGGRLYVSWIKTAGENCGNFGVDASFAQESADFDGDALGLTGKLDDGLYIRNWEPGDEYLRTGHEKPEKIKSLFQEYRIVLWDRRRWPVLILDDEIVWSLRFGPAAKFAARGESRSVLRLLYRM